MAALTSMTGNNKDGLLLKDLMNASYTSCASLHGAAALTSMTGEKQCFGSRSGWNPDSIVPGDPEPDRESESGSGQANISKSMVCRLLCQKD
jgi:hypothetical protein